MTIDKAKLARQSTIALGIAIFWFAISKLNECLFPICEHTERANWIFLPAAFRPLIILMFEMTGTAGLVLGAFLTVCGTTHGDILHAAAFSAVLGFTPWAGVALGRWLLDIPESLAGLQAKHIVLLCTLCACANAVTLNGYLWASGHFDGGYIQIFTVLVGDLIGAAILLFLISSILAFALPRRL